MPVMVYRRQTVTAKADFRSSEARPDAMIENIIPSLFVLGIHL